jgi:hypothetical protein
LINGVAGSGPGVLDDGTWVGFDGASDPHPGITFNLGGAFNVDAVNINYMSAAGSSGISAPQSAQILFSTDGVTFGGAQTLTGFIDPAGDFNTQTLVAPLGGVPATHIQLNLLNNAQWTFLGEVGFEGAPVPEPAALSLLIVGGVTLTFRRRVARHLFNAPR